MVLHGLYAHPVCILFALQLLLQLLIGHLVLQFESRLCIALMLLLSDLLYFVIMIELHSFKEKTLSLQK